MNKKSADFLATVKPFDLLPRDELLKTAQKTSLNTHPAGKLLFIQNRTILNRVYIVFQGSLEKYLQEKDQKKMIEVLGPKDIYGGLSILFNKGLSIRTVLSLDKSSLYSLPGADFLDLCTRFPQFIQHFTKQFGIQMMHSPYMSFMARSPINQEASVSSGFLNLALQDIFSRDFASCSQNLSIQDAARIMSSKKRSSIVITDDMDQSVGLLTDHDLRSKVVSRNHPLHRPVGEVASSPLITLSAQARVFDAILKMMKHNIKHLVITGEEGDILGIATEQDLLLAQGKSPIYLMREIQLAGGVSDLEARYRQLPGMIKSLLDSGAKSGHLNSIITEISDSILNKTVEFALEQAGPPPVKFAFMIMGSEGRREQTLKTDQDNAIVYQDVDQQRTKEVHSYFVRLGELISAGLDQVGFSFCRFQVMARNPKWCQPLEVWQQYFWNWIHNAEPEDLLHSSIFFDFRFGYGDRELVDRLGDYMFRTLGNWLGFFRHMAENALRFKPPLDFFGNLVLKTIDKKKNCLDIKQPMQMIVDYARIYALQNRLPETNTMDRLEKLNQLGVLDRKDYHELAHAYSFLMLIRLSHQVDQLVVEGQPADNYIQPGELTYIHKQSLKEAMKGIRNAQSRMRMDLTQDIGIT